ERADVFGGAHGHTRSRAFGRGRDVREKHGVLELEQGGLDRGLALVHVQAGAGDDTFLQRLRESLLVDDRAAGRVYEDRGALHLAETVGVHEVTSLGEKRNVQRDEVTPRQQVVEAIDVRRADLLLRPEIAACIV